jgi:hypothetical protein
MFDWLESQDWENACALLNYQLKRKNDPVKPNRHFDTLSFDHYQEPWELLKKTITNPDYFPRFVQTGFLLSDETLAFSYLYPSKKGLGKFRNTVFLSLHLRLMYYAIGIHFARKEGHPIVSGVYQTSYGGNLIFDQQGKLQEEPSTVYYKEHYQSFYKTCIEFVDAASPKIKGKPKLRKIPRGYKRCVIKLDIENFYDQISHLTFFDLLDSTHQHKSFGTTLLLQLIVHAEKGLPQTCNDVIAGFLSCLYLRKFDTDLQKFLEEAHPNHFNVFRYCDDTHIFIDYESTKNTEEVQTIAYNIIAKCKNILYEQYKLKMNNKTIYYDFKIKKDRESYRNSLKNLSHQDDSEPLDDNIKYCKDKHFSLWKSKFEKSAENYLKTDLIKQNELTPDINDGLKIIYHKQFRLDLEEKYNSTGLPETILYLLREALNQPKSPYLYDKPKLFTFLGSFITGLHEYMEQNHLSKACEKDNFTGAIALLDFAIEFPEQKYRKAFYRTTLFKGCYKSISQYTYEKLNIHSKKPHKLSYLTCFTLQRRNAEQQGKYSQALSFLNSELCILLAILKVSNKTTHEIPYSLGDFSAAKSTILDKIREQRNCVDVSHNQKAFPKPKSLQACITKDEYNKLKCQGLKAVETLAKKPLLPNPI